MPNSPGAPSDIVTFGDDKVKGMGGAKPVYGTDYMLEPTPDGKALKLTYTDGFLKANERSRANIGAAITLYSTDGRKFNRIYKFDLEANTPPPDPGITFAKTTGSPSYYVLCIEVPNMPGAVVNGKPLHKDIAHIAINDTEYELKMKDDDSGFEPKSAPFIAAGAVAQLYGIPKPSGPWVLYYKTSTAIGGPQASYTVTLKDAKGLGSQISATTPPVPITDWEVLRTAVQTASDGAVITVGGDITYDYTDAKSTIKVTKSITVKSDGTRRILNAGGTGADGVSANSKVEAVFEVDGSGIMLKLEDLTLSQTEKYAVYVHNGASLEMTRVTIEDCKTSFNAAGIYFHKGKNLTVTNSLIKKCKGKGSSSSGGIDIQEPQTDGTLSITNTRIENCKAVGNGTDKGNGGGINIYKGSLTLRGCTLTGCEAKNGGGVYVRGDGTSLTMTDGKITHCKAEDTLLPSLNGRGGGIYGDNSSLSITIKGTAEISYNESTCQGVGSGGGICGGNNSIITVSENATIQNNKAKGFGGGVYFKGIFKFTGGTIAGNQVTDATSLGTGIFLENSGTILEMSGNARVANDNDIYLPDNRVVTITGALSNNPVARITVPAYKYNTNTQVLEAGSGVNLANEHTKFTVTPKGSEEWGVDVNGKLKKLGKVMLYVQAAYRTIQVKAVTADNSAITVEGADTSAIASGIQTMFTATGTSITLKGSITELDCSGTTTSKNITALAFSGCTALQKLQCNYTLLTSLDVSSLTALQKLQCNSNAQLTSLNVSGLTALQELQCNSNDQLISLNVSGCTALKMLSCGNNKLTNLNVSGLTALKELHCFQNKLVSLTISNSPALIVLNCKQNLLDQNAFKQIFTNLPMRAPGHKGKCYL